MPMRRRGSFRIPWGFLILQAVSLILIGALILAQLLICRIPVSQKAADRWSADEERFTQVSIFIEKGEGLSLPDINTIRSGVDTALRQASMTAASENARAWIDAWHAESSQSFTSSRASVTADVIGVGGDFFHFHPFQLHDGYYFSDSAILHDRILIDEITAWQLFGSFDVAGMEVTVGKRPFIIAGVLKDESDFASRAALGDEHPPRIYMSYTALSDLDEAIEICCYEAVLPDPVSGFGCKLITDNLRIDENARIVVENSLRYDFVPLLKLAGSFGQRSMQKAAIKLPYWENAARMIEEYAALFQIVWLSLCIIPLLALIIAVVFLWKNRRFHFRDIPDLYERLITAYRMRKNDRKLLSHTKRTIGGKHL